MSLKISQDEDICRNYQDDNGSNYTKDGEIDVFDVVWLDYRSNYGMALNSSIKRHKGYHVREIIPFDWELYKGRNQTVTEGFLIHYVKNKINDEEKKPVENMNTFVDVVSGDTDGVLTNAINDSIRNHEGFIIANLKSISESRILIQYQRKKEDENIWKWKSSI